ncbi:MAG: Uma2 family endonuclease [Planctomycetales bacterium]|nr:Uma2 family endonuclease [Planctomycetales bacterium]
MASETRTDGLSLDKPLPLDLHPNIDHLVMEDDAPVDNIYSEKQQRLLIESLHSSWQRRDAAPFVAFANVGLFYKLHGTPYVTDAMLSLDVDLPENIWIKQHRSYLVWEFGKPPEVVIEIVSNREGGEGDSKLKGYAQIGVKFYVIHDPECQLSDQILRAFKLDGSEYRQLGAPVYFEGIGLGLQLWEGMYENRHDTWLRWHDEHGRLIPTGAERAETAEQRSRRLEEQLRRVGIEPE